MHRLRPRPWLAVVATIVFSRGPRAALADELPGARTSRTSSLSWIRLPGAEPCVSAQDLARDVELRLGHPVFVSPSQADVSVEGHIEPGAGAHGWHAVVVLRDAHGAPLGTRELRREEAACDSMRAPLGLVIAIMIDPDATLSPRPPPPPPPAAAAPPAPVVIERQVPVIVRAPDTDAASRGWRLDAGSGLVGGLGLLPAPSVGLSGQVILEPPIPLGFEGYAALWLDQTPGPTFSLGYVGGGLCPLQARSPLLDAYACASGQLGYLNASGGAVTPAGQVHVALDAEARATLHLVGPFTARGGFSLIVPLLRDAFAWSQAGGSPQSFRMSAVAATLDLGLGVAFP